MAIEIQVPKLGLTMEEATLTKWNFAPGELVKEDEIVLILETDKVSYEMPSPGDGLLHPLAAPGETIKVGQVIGYLAVDEAELEKLQAEQPAVEPPEAAVAPSRRPADAPAAGPSAPNAPAASDGRIKASPLARAMARKHGLDLAAVAGSGPGGRIVRADILKALETGGPAAAVPELAAAEGELLSVAEEIPITGVRKVIFKNMHLSLTTQAQLTLHTEASAVELVELRRKLNQAAGEGVKVGYNAILAKVIAQALKRHPRLNASVEGEVIKIWRQIHVGVAVDLGQGLIVPKIRHADARSIREIQAELDRLLGAAKDGRLMPDDLAAGTFTLTNLGAWEVDQFTPIVNNPESAILGVGRIVDKPTAKDGQVVVEPRLALSLSFDHRIIDGAPGAAFLKTIKELIEQPLLML